MPRAEPSSDTCTFCRIVAGESPAHLVSSDETCLALLAAPPAAYGHVLVIPRQHVDTLWEADAPLAEATMRTAQRISVLLRQRLGPDGLTVRQNNGSASGQVISHLHIHLVPRWHGDGSIGWPHPPTEPLDPDTVLRTLLAQ
ncbi:histidine triad (HIT) family protein [Saccharopolyspora lacisalsi]|uniref:Histidine triad (HIT) family protein n=1 Tax=Halosaccharopolyspora lacisalsi TaxID=1000566 RepID=A0A839DZL2_9PSEU|nr:HIT family protein [Halosaccharopolyspora lacisalsi]MBA8826280.1 histidine triad (HIT) family protein [Halosaccharopolyspora lacisalsi]